MSKIPFLSDLISWGVALATFKEQMQKMEDRVNEIEKNYIKQFQEVRKDISDSQKEVMSQMNINHIELIDRINKK